MYWKPLTSFAIALGLSQYCVDAAHAQSPPPRHLTVHKIEFGIDDNQCKPSSVWIVINDIDRPREATKVGSLWTVDTGGRTFDAASAHASLRVDGQRTDCWKSNGLDFDREIAKFAFPRCPTKSAQKTITIFTVPGMDISYVRNFRGQSGSVLCRERAAFSSADPYQVTSLQFPNEKLVLQLDRQEPDPDAPGLRINDLIDLYRSTAKSNFAFLTPGGIAYAVAVQRVKGIGSTPNLSSNAIDLQLRKLHDAKLEKLALRVE
jgi:hypothetical protein